MCQSDSAVPPIPVDVFSTDFDIFVDGYFDVLDVQVFVAIWAGWAGLAGRVTR